MSPLEQVRAAVAASSETADLDLSAIWLAAARVVLDRHRREVDACLAVLISKEQLLVRLVHNEAEQLKLGATP